MGGQADEDTGAGRPGPGRAPWRSAWRRRSAGPPGRPAPPPGQQPGRPVPPPGRPGAPAPRPGRPRRRCAAPRPRDRRSRRSAPSPRRGPCWPPGRTARRPGAGRGGPGGPGRLPVRRGQAGRDHDQGQALGRSSRWWAALGRGPGRVLHGRRLREDPPGSGLVEQALRLGVGGPVHRRPGAGPVPGRDPGRRGRGLAVVHDRRGRAALRAATGQRALLLRERAGRPGLHPHRAAQRARPPQRPQRDDLPQPAGRRERQLQGQPGQVRDRGADQRVRRLVRRRGLPALRGDDQLRRGHPAAGHRLVPRSDGRGADGLRAARDPPARISGTDFTGEARFGLDFLQRMWHQRTRTLYYQVGTGEANNYYTGDHDIWRLPQADDHYQGSNPHDVYIRHPPVFRAGKPGAPISPNLAWRWPPTSRSATRCSGTPTRATRRTACARPRPCTRRRARTGRGSCSPRCPGTSTRRPAGGTT